MSSLFSIGDDELDLLDDEDFLLEACEVASSNLSTNLKGTIDRISVGNCTKLSITRQQDAGTMSSCETGLRKPLESLCHNATDGRVAYRKSTVDISGNRTCNLGARAKFITDQNRTLNSVPDNFSVARDLSRGSPSSNIFSMSPPSKRVAVQTVASSAGDGNVHAPSYSNFKPASHTIGSKPQDIGPNCGLGERNNLVQQRRCALQTHRQNLISFRQKMLQDSTWLEETEYSLPGRNLQLVSEDINCGMNYGIEKQAEPQSTYSLTAVNRNVPKQSQLQSSVTLSENEPTIEDSQQFKSNRYSGTALKGKVNVQMPKANSSVMRTPEVRHHCIGDITPLRTPRSTPRTRKFPGPAGLLPKLSPNQDLGKLSSPQPVVRSSPAVQEKVRTPTLNEDEDFIRDPWVTMVTEFNQGVPSSMRYTVIQTLTKAALHQLHRGKVPSLCVLVKAFLPTDTDASIVLKDPTGEIRGTVHRKVLEEFPSELGPGTGLILRQVSVFSPCPRRHYLNITPGNIVEFYPADPTAVASSQPLTTQATQNGSTKHVQRISVGDEDTKETVKRRTTTLEVEEFALDALDDQLLCDAADDELLLEASQSVPHPGSADHEWQEDCYDDLLEGLENEDDALDEALLV